MMRMEKAGSKEGDSAKRRRNGNGAKIIGSGTLNGKSFFIRRIGSNPSCVCRPDFERPWTMWWHSFAQNAVRRQSASPLTSRRAEKALASCSPPETGWVRSSQPIKTDSQKNPRTVSSSTYARLGSTLTISGERNVPKWL